MKPQKVIVDTGPIVAFLNKKDRYHEWTKAQLATMCPPLLTCESAISESCFLLRHYENGASNVLILLERKLLTIPFRLEDELIAVKELLNKYNNIPMSLADGCLVRLAEQITDSVVLLWTAISKYIERKVGRSYPQLCRMTYSSINHSGLNCGDICSILNGYLSSSFALLNLRERIKDILKSRILEKNDNVNKILKNNQLGTRDVAATERMLENLLNQVNSIEVLYVYQAFDYS